MLQKPYHMCQMGENFKSKFLASQLIFGAKFLLKKEC